MKNAGRICQPRTIQLTPVPFEKFKNKQQLKKYKFKKTNNVSFMGRKNLFSHPQKKKKATVIVLVWLKSKREIIRNYFKKILKRGKAFKIINRESGAIESLGERKFYPKGAASYEKLLIGGKNAKREKVSIEVFIFKNSDGKVLGRLTDRTEGVDKFSKGQKYQYNSKDSISITTWENKNNHRIFSQQEVRSIYVDEDSSPNKIIINRAIVSKNYIDGDVSLDTHSIADYQNGKAPRKLKFNFQRDKYGNISSPLNFEEIPKGEHTIDLSDPYLVTYFNPNKTEVARDFVKINMDKLGFPEMPKVEIFYQTNANTNALLLNGECLLPALGINLSKTGKRILTPIYAYPVIKINIAKPKIKMASSAAHESEHLRQSYEAIVLEDLLKMDETARFWWEKIISQKSVPNRGSLEYRKKFIQALIEIQKNNYHLKKGKIAKGKYIERYLNNPLEIDALEMGEIAAFDYMSNIGKFLQNFPSADWKTLSD